MKTNGTFVKSSCFTDKIQHVFETFPKSLGRLKYFRINQHFPHH